MNELPELYYSGSLNAIDMANISKNFKELYAIRPSIEQLNSTSIDQSAKLLISIADKCDNLNEKYIEVPHSHESSDEEYIKVPHSNESSDGKYIE